MKKKSFLFVAAFCFTISSYSAGHKPVPSHPFLLVTDSSLKQIRQNIKQKNWKYQSWLTLKAAADKLLKEPVEIPPRGGNWEHYYVSPVTGKDLVRGRQLGDWRWEHTDTTTHEVFASDRHVIEKDLDGVIISLLHDSWALAALQLGLAYQISNDRKYSLKAKKILLAYATIYPSLPERNLKNESPLIGVPANVGKVHVQNLNEAIWLINMVQCADLIWNTLSDNEQKLFARTIFYPATAAILRQGTNTISNIQCWKNAAIGITGFLLGDNKLIEKAMSDTTAGYFQLLKKGITREGIWIDRSPSYHFYALRALVMLSQAASNYGYPINFQPLRKMFTGPILLADAGFNIPAFNDSRHVNLYAFRPLYEWAYTQFKDSRYATLLNLPSRHQYQNTGPSFMGWGMLFGQSVLPVTKEWPVTSKNFAETGIGMLSKGNLKNNLTFYIKYNPIVSEHKHHDVLDIALSKGGEPVLLLPGAVSYASLLTTQWYRSSLAHNTFVINRFNQNRFAKGTCLAFGSEAGVNYTITQTTNAVDSSLRYIRSAAMLSNNLLVLIDQIQYKKNPTVFDIAFHHGGDWIQTLTGENVPFLGRPGYNRLIEPVLNKNQQEVQIATRLKSGREVMFNATASVPIDLITAYGEPSGNRKNPTTICRIRTNNAVLVSCISTNGQKIKLQLETLKDAQNNNIDMSKAVKILLEDSIGKRTSIIINPDKLLVNEIGSSANKFVTVQDL